MLQHCLFSHNSSRFLCYKLKTATKGLQASNPNCAAWRWWLHFKSAQDYSVAHPGVQINWNLTLITMDNQWKGLSSGYKSKHRWGWKNSGFLRRKSMRQGCFWLRQKHNFSEKKTKCLDNRAFKRICEQLSSFIAGCKCFLSFFLHREETILTWNKFDFERSKSQYSPSQK